MEALKLLKDGWCGPGRANTSAGRSLPSSETVRGHRHLRLNRNRSTAASMMARALRPSQVALYVALIVLGTFWGSSVVFLRLVRARTAALGGGRPSFETCEDALTFWTAASTVPIDREPVEVGQGLDQSVPHVSQCRRCCACDWHRTQEWLRLLPEIDAWYQPAPQPLTVTANDMVDLNPQEGEKAPIFVDDSDVGASLGTPTGLRGSDYENPAAQQSSSGTTSSRQQSSYESALLRSRNRLDVSWRPALPETIRGDSSLRDCGLCYGCSQVLLSSPPYLIGFNHTFKALPSNRQGAEVYRAYGSSSSPPRLGDMPLMVKVWSCSESDSSHLSPAMKRSRCPKGGERAALYSAAMAVQILVEDMQQAVGSEVTSIARSLFPRTWVHGIQGVLLGSGERVSGDVLAFEPSSGIPAARLMGHPWPWVAIKALERLGHQQLLAAAVMDVLLMNCNRDLEDVVIGEDGRLRLVNNEQVFGHTVDGRRCITNSVFIPTSQNFKIATLGLEYMAGLKEQPRSEPQLAQLLDYRCHLPEESTALGSAYPAEVTEVLDRLSKLRVAEVAEYYGLPDGDKRASLLRMRAQDMLIHGFEWTIDHADRTATVVSTNQNYQFDDSWPEPCCAMEYTDQGLSCLK